MKCPIITVRGKTPLFCIVLLLLGCAAMPPFRKEAPRDDSRTRAEREFDPLSLDEENPIVTESALQEEEIPAERETFHPPTSEEEGGRTRRLGYRIQIYASTAMDLAQQAAREAQGRMNEKVYVEFDAPYYKVRLGDCATSEEAQLLREQAIRVGYENAWVVRTAISADEESRD